MIALAYKFLEKPAECLVWEWDDSRNCFLSIWFWEYFADGI